MLYYSDSQKSFRYVGGWKAYFTTALLVLGRHELSLARGPLSWFTALVALLDLLLDLVTELRVGVLVLRRHLERFAACECSYREC